ncbi:MAG: phosphoribosyltransferase [Candidatus Omnitrophota bacterium]
MKKISFKEIASRIDAFEFPKVDTVIGISTGGIVASSLIAQKLGCELSIIHLSYRDENNTPLYPEPVCLNELNIPENNKRILLVDDVFVSGKTLQKAKTMLQAHDVTTCVLSGKAAIVLFPEITSCVRWPWTQDHSF